MRPVTTAAVKRENVKQHIALNRYILILVIFLIVAIVALVSERKFLFGSKQAQDSKHLHDHHLTYEEEESQHDLQIKQFPLPVLRKISVVEGLARNNAVLFTQKSQFSSQHQQHQQDRCVLYGNGVGLKILDFDEKEANKEVLVDISPELTGKVTLFVNLASKCGFTDSGYKALVTLDKFYNVENSHHYKRQFRIVGVPSNDFGQQEPGTVQEIRHFAKEKYGADFRIYAKASVVGAEASPLFQQLTRCAPKKGGSAVIEPVSWNFNFFLVNGDGSVVARFPPGTPAGIMMKIIDPLMN